ncbi:hypothetical protein AN639_11565 [Candidatus Epulonipiscium fishelsonii]|uniref:Uncharacterized protein n=1 Tax=Candidatus Epulonipiscium fishelsonii TaxID=77094 RepID=A0ACC8X7X4_9FIRM|nr:hypothetical protein AN396_11445 [Epulopiscium sp. SCG-B11WGA-EpuloA1]ONI43086.1 hypothetical protein AN639_11565 [Epulopiscium sp. SCG-B05WGA-EpuloA1]ONI48018.1 hypothetical protein AN644_02985 [Epulopiscium sp. SCG-C06WGA-EpuloA1]
MTNAMLQSIVNTSTSYVILKDVDVGNEGFDETLQSLIKPVKPIEASLSTTEKPPEKNTDAQVAFNVLKFQTRFF